MNVFCGVVWYGVYSYACIHFSPHSLHFRSFAEELYHIHIVNAVLSTASEIETFVPIIMHSTKSVYPQKSERPTDRVKESTKRNGEISTH